MKNIYVNPEHQLVPFNTVIGYYTDTHDFREDKKKLSMSFNLSSFIIDKSEYGHMAIRFKKLGIIKPTMYRIYDDTLALTYYRSISSTGTLLIETSNINTYLVIEFAKNDGTEFVNADINNILNTIYISFYLGANDHKRIRKLYVGSLPVYQNHYDISNNDLSYSQYPDRSYTINSSGSVVEDTSSKSVVVERLNTIIDDNKIDSVDITFDDTEYSVKVYCYSNTNNTLIGTVNTPSYIIKHNSGVVVTNKYIEHHYELPKDSSGNPTTNYIRVLLTKNSDTFKNSNYIDQIYILRINEVNSNVGTKSVKKVYIGDDYGNAKLVYSRFELSTDIIYTEKSIANNVYSVARTNNNAVYIVTKDSVGNNIVVLNNDLSKSYLCYEYDTSYTLKYAMGISTDKYALFGQFKATTPSFAKSISDVVAVDSNGVLNRNIYRLSIARSSEATIGKNGAKFLNYAMFAGGTVYNDSSIPSNYYNNIDIYDINSLSKINITRTLTVGRTADNVAINNKNAVVLYGTINNITTSSYQYLDFINGEDLNTVYTDAGQRYIDGNLSYEYDYGVSVGKYAVIWDQKSKNLLSINDKFTINKSIPLTVTKQLNTISAVYSNEYCGVFAGVGTDSKYYMIIVYPDLTTETRLINNYVSEITSVGDKLVITGLNGKIYTLTF